MPKISRRTLVLAALTVLAPATTAEAASPDLVISQVYGGGGNSGAPLRNDFIEVFNRGTDPVDVGGWSVQYASATGTTWTPTNLSGVVAPGRYLLVREAAGANAAAELPAAEASGNIAMSATAGKVRLVAASGGVRDLVGYGATASPFEGSGPAPTLANTTAALRDDDGCADTDDNAADFSSAAPAPRNSAAAATDCLTPPPPPPLVAIYDIQGAGHSSPHAGEAVTTTGVVTAKRSNGYYLQDPAADDDPATSDGVFVFTGGAPAVSVGDALRLEATVQEFRAGGASSTNLTITELTSPAITDTTPGAALPAPVVVGPGGRTPPAEIIEDDAFDIFDADTDGIDFYESLEGMRVQVDDAVATGPTRDFGSNREIPVLAAGGQGAGVRTTRGGIVVRPGDFNPERIILNDLIAGGPSMPQVDAGDTFAGSTVGVVDYSFGNYKLEVAALPAIVDGGLQRETTAAAGVGELSAATFNVENLDPGDPAEKFAALAHVITDNLRAPDLISVEEVQDDTGPSNDGTVSAALTWQKLIDAVQAAGGPAYDYRQIDPAAGNPDGGQPGGNIRVGFLFRSDRGLAFVDRPGGDATTPVAVVGDASGPRLSISPGRIQPASSAFSNSRKPLVGEFTYDGRRLFAIANHWNSKGGDQPLFGRFQPPARSSEVQRTAQAQLVHDFVDDVVSDDPDARVFVLGDLNDFEFSPALATLQGSPPILHDLALDLPQPERYSYVFEGNSQTLDHIVASPALVGAVRAFDPVHVNAEFADQTSDHDPLVARVCADVTVPSLTVTASASVLRPPNHKYVAVTVTSDATDSVDPHPAVTLVSATSSEPDDAPGGADGATTGDIVVVDDTTFRLRAERSETGSGRVYTLTYQAVDACGNSVRRSAAVSVPTR